MLELLLIDELERIGKKDLARKVYEEGITEETKQMIYPIFLRTLTNKDRKTFLTIDKGLLKIGRRLRRSKDTESLAYKSLSSDEERLLALKDHKLDGYYHLKDANNKYLACAIASCLKTEVEEKGLTK